tara:strand:- start:210 stop:410 length:201 start_codon:yes stop_codon:yes gene_type:complete
MDYEIGFKILTSVVLGWFWLDKNNTRSDIKKIEDKVNGHATEVAVLREQIKSVKEDTLFIREHIGE